MTGFSCLVDPRRLRAISLFAATQDIRFYLNSVAVEWLADGRPLLVASNGHMLAAMPAAGNDVVNEAPPAGFASCLLSAPVLALALKVHGKAKEPIQLTINPENRADVSISTANGASFGKAGIDHTPIEWRRVLPKFSPDATPDGALSINGSYLAVFAKAGLLLSPRGRFGASLAIRRGDPNGAVLVQLPDVPEFLGLCMPMRTDANGEVPSWVTGPAPVAQAAA